MVDRLDTKGKSTNDIWGKIHNHLILEGLDACPKHDKTYPDGMLIIADTRETFSPSVLFENLRHFFKNYINY